MNLLGTHTVKKEDSGRGVGYFDGMDGFKLAVD